MKFPEKCPKCNKMVDISSTDGCYFFERGDPDFDRDTPDRIVDSIMECSACHTLLRFRWKLETIHVLVEKEL